MKNKHIPIISNDNIEIYVDGKGHYKDKLINEIEIASILEEKHNPILISDFLKDLNGFYNVVVSYKDGKKLFAVDHIRSKPIFFKKDGSWSDNAFYFSENNQALSKTAVAAFLKTGWTIGASTLAPDVFQVVAGEHVIINTDLTIEKRVAFSHHHDDSLHGKKKQEISELLWNISNNFTKRLVGFANTRPIIVPLSGGYDSRYIAAMLKLTGAENVILLSYGQKDSFEIATAQQVAKKLGYQWKMVDYNPGFLKKYIVSENFKKYCFHSSGGASLPHIQEFAMLSWLKDNKIIPDDSVFSPGFCGDVLGGSFIPPFVTINNTKDLTKHNIYKYIFDKLFYLENTLTNNQSNCIHKDIKESINDIEPQSIEDFCSEFENWLTLHRLSKFITNGVRAYDFFGYDWYLPLWDHELVNIWYKVPLKHRVNKTLYDNFLLDEVFTPLGVAFKKEHSWLSSSSAGILRPYISNKIKRPIKKIYHETTRLLSGRRSYDQNGFHEIEKWFADDLLKTKNIGIPVSGNINQAEACWFLENIEIIKKHA